MSFQVVCPGCRAELMLPTAPAGGLVECGACGQQMQLAAPAAAPSARPASLPGFAPPPARRSAPNLPPVRPPPARPAPSRSDREVEREPRRRRADTDASPAIAAGFALVALTIAASWAMLLAGGAFSSLGLFIATATVAGLATVFCLAYFFHAVAQVDDRHAGAWFGGFCLVEGLYFLCYFGVRNAWLSPRLLVTFAVLYMLLGVCYWVGSIVYSAVQRKHMAAVGAFLMPFAFWAAWIAVVLVVEWRNDVDQTRDAARMAWNWRGRPREIVVVREVPAAPVAVAAPPPAPAPAPAPPERPFFADARDAARSAAVKAILERADEARGFGKIAAVLEQLAAANPDRDERGPILTALASRFGDTRLVFDGRKSLVNLPLQWDLENAAKYLRIMARTSDRLTRFSDEARMLVDAAVKVGSSDAYALLCELVDGDRHGSNHAEEALADLGAKAEDAVAAEWGKAVGPRKRALLRVWEKIATAKTKEALEVALKAAGPAEDDGSRRTAWDGPFRAAAEAEGKDDLKKALLKIAAADVFKVEAALNDLFVVDGPAADEDKFVAAIGAVGGRFHGDVAIGNAVRLIAKFAPSKVVEYLSDGLHRDRFHWHKDALAAALVKLKTPEAFLAMARYLELLDRRRVFFEEQSRDRVALALMDAGPAAEDAVLPLLDSANYAARVVAVQILAKIGTPKAVPKLRVILREVKANVKTANAFFGEKSKQQAAQAFVEKVIRDINARAKVEDAKDGDGK